MRALIQRVASAEVESEGKVIGKIDKGFLVFVAFKQTDTDAEIEWFVKKIINLRIFEDAAGKLNLCIKEVKGEILIVSQFTLYADAQKGNRPSFMESAPPEIAISLYEKFIISMRKSYAGRIETGKFGATMQVQLTNDGPVTIWLEKEHG